MSAASHLCRRRRRVYGVGWHSPLSLYSHTGYGCNPDLAHDAVKEHVEPLLKADFRLFETYQPRLAVLPYAVVACAAVGDDRVLDSQLEAWRERCGGGFAMRRFDATWPPWGRPHRWPVDDPIAFLAWFGPWLCSH